MNPGENHCLFWHQINLGRKPTEAVLHTKNRQVLELLAKDMNARSVHQRRLDWTSERSLGYCYGADRLWGLGQSLGLTVAGMWETIGGSSRVRLLCSYSSLVAAVGEQKVSEPCGVSSAGTLRYSLFSGKLPPSCCAELRGADAFNIYVAVLLNATFPMPFFSSSNKQVSYCFFLYTFGHLFPSVFLLYL